MTIFKNLLLYLLLSLILILLYAELSHFWVNCGGLRSKITYIELPILLVLLLVLYFPTKNIFKNSFLSVISILGLYILYDIFYHFLARSSRLSDFSNATALSDFSLIMSAGLVIMILLIISPILYMIYNFKKNSKKQTFYSLISIKIVVLVGLFFYLNTSHFSHYLFKKFDYCNWSQGKTIKTNGRFTSFIYYGIISMQAKEKLNLYNTREVNIDKLLFDNLKIKNKRNIYIVVLESFVDPRLIKDATFSRSPLFQNMQKYLGGEEFSYITSSIYGGGTAQSEFEILTGVPALSKVSSIEFNTLDGNQISGFVNALKQNGYKTKATIGSYSGYYNSKDAYKSIGFDKTIFLEESDDFQLIDGDERIFDGDLYDYNLRKLKEENIKTPYLNYVLGMYGHFPYERNLNLRPDIVTTTYKDLRIHRIANQFYYRTKTLVNYMDNILSYDPSAIIFVSSDHLPPLLTNGIKYTKSQTENIALLFVDGKAIDINGRHYYDIPRLIWKILNNDKKELKKIDTKVYEEIYFKALSESLQ